MTPTRPLLSALAAVFSLAAGCNRDASTTGPDTEVSRGGTCVSCHVGITNPHDRFALRCADCHGGDQKTEVSSSFGARLLSGDPALRADAEFQAALRRAHVTPTASLRDHFQANGVDYSGHGDLTVGWAKMAGTNRASDPNGDTIDSEFNQDLNYVRFINPGDLRAASMSCGDQSPATELTGQCHASEVSSVRKHIMTTNAGVIDGAYYGNRQLPGDPAPPPASNGDPRGGRFGFVIDWIAIDAQASKDENRFTGDDQAHAGTISVTLSATTLVHGDGQPQARFPWGGTTLQFPERPLESLSTIPDRPTLDGSPLAATAASLSGGALPAGFTGANPVDSVLAGFRAFHTHLTPSPARNFFIAAFKDVPPNPYGRGRGSGCTGCHMLYDNDGHNHEPVDPTVKNNGRQVTTDIAAGIVDFPSNTFTLDTQGQKFYPKTHHLTTRIPTQQCGLCHGFVTRVDQAYEGRFELAGGTENDRSLLSPSFHRPSDGKLVQVFPNLAEVVTNTATVLNAGEGDVQDTSAALELPDRVKRSEAFDGRQLRIVYGGADGTTRLQDIHFEKGMHCIDCHFMQDTHGDGNIYARNWDLVEVECDDCHGTPGALAELKTSGPTGGNDLTRARDEGGLPFFEILASGDRIQRSRVTPGLAWRIPQVKEAITAGDAHFNPRAKAAMGQAATHGPASGKNAHIAERNESGRLECYSCHNSWTPSCMTCHFNTDFDAAAAGNASVDVGGVKGQRGIWTDSDKRQGFTDFALFGYTRSPFVLGQAGLTEKGKIATFRSTMEVHASISGPVQFGPVGSMGVDKNATILDNLTFTTGVPSASADIASGVAMNMFMPHTVRLHETRDCESCHTLVDPGGKEVNNHILAGTLGYGTGRYQNLGDWLLVATGGGLRQANFKKQTLGPHNVWPGFVLDDHTPRTVSASAAPAMDVALIRNFTPKGQAPRGVDLAFVAEGAAAQLRVVDTTNRDIPDANRAPRADVLVALAGSANAVKVISPDLSDPRVFCAVGASGLQIVDASGYFASTPSVTAAAAISWTGADARDLDVRGAHAFVADGSNGFSVVRVSGGTLGLEANVPVAGGVCKRVVVMDRFAFVAAGAMGLQVFDLGSPASPTPVFAGSLTSDGVNPIDAESIAIEGSKAVIAGGAAGIHLVDVTRPRAPLFVRTVKAFNGADSIGSAVDVVVGSVPLKIFAVVADAGTSRVLIVNLTDPLDARERLLDHAADDASYRFSLERRDPLTPRDTSNADLWHAGAAVSVTGVLAITLSDPPRRIAPGSALDRLADESGRRLRESWQEGAGVIPPDQAARMRAVVVEETPGTTDQDDKSGNGLGTLRIK